MIGTTVLDSLVQLVGLPFLRSDRPYRVEPVAFFCASSFPTMYLLYLDESGNEKGAEDRHFVLAGVAAFERQTYFLEQALNQIQADRFPGLPPEPFHANAVRAGRGFGGRYQMQPEWGCWTI